MIRPEALNERSHQGRTNIGLGYKRCREQLPDIAVDIADAVLRGDVGEVAGPGISRIPCAV